MRKIIARLLFFILIVSSAKTQEMEKPFIIEHKSHKHKIDIINGTVYQQIGKYGTLYTTFHIFGSYNLNENDKVFFNLSYTKGNGITIKTQKEGYSFYTSADDLENYLKNINSTGRKYLLEAFYQKKLNKITIIAGIIDSTAFIDTNKFANDEHTQFLNSFFINNPLVTLPSYNPGIYANIPISQKNSLSILYMASNPDSGTVGILELKHISKKHNFRVFYSKSFCSCSNNGLGLSYDITTNNKKGFFFRSGLSKNNYFLSGGLQIMNIWVKDKLSIGYAFLTNSSNPKAIEIYYLFHINDFSSLTFDIQYISEKNSDYVYGSRFYIYF